MGLRCRSGHHVPAPDGVRNQGFEFSHCRMCRCDLVRSNRNWKAVPNGFRVVWKHGKAWPPEVEASQFLLDLSNLDVGLAVPYSEPRRLFRRLDLLALALRFLVMMAVERLRAWRISLLSPPPACRPVLRLAGASPRACGGAGTEG